MIFNCFMILENVNEIGDDIQLPTHLCMLGQEFRELDKTLFAKFLFECLNAFHFKGVCRPLVLQMTLQFFRPSRNYIKTERWRSHNLAAPKRSESGITWEQHPWIVDSETLPIQTYGTPISS